MAILPLAVEEEIMASTKQSSTFPRLHLPDERVADPGKVRLGDSAITAEFPPLRRPDEKIADPGKVRLGDSAITAAFPLKK
jgi:hypothetical protein